MNTLAITIPVLVVLAVLFILPNYIAVRYALLGDILEARRFQPRRALSARRGAAADAPAAAPPVAQRRPVHLWKALSPLLFAVCLILGIAIGETAGLALAGVAFLNLLWGFTGWRGVG